MSGPRTAPVDVTGPAGTAFCVRCGQPAAVGDHTACRARAAYDPPRFCPHCARRMVVQVTPSGWSARCSAHGAVDPSGAAGAVTAG